ncbi:MULTISPECIES: tannase/feruloyl esterase family alpha/beta hydrolase [Methylobacterium]|uniref:Tannase n=1 Tax=Methylobacterium aquaticum TaxID=270351 RepID=A0A0C6FQP1_9HYPH|nr:MULTISPECIES: tannase/feruloyl esterase family alpha/beta hydrolase [Methylobacterium]BAQ47614.1 tannase [Methylobacterium aquaticum]
MLNLSRPLRPAQIIAMLSIALPLWLPLQALAQSSGTDIAAAQVPVLAVVKPARACTDLATVALDDIGGAGSRITEAAVTSDGAAPACAVKGMLAPSIGFEVRLPTETWTQRYLQVGCGGLCGNIRLTPGAAEGCLPLQAGDFVVGSTDMGHQGRDASFGDDPQKRADFAHRAQHLTALTAKRLIAAFYGRPQAYAYFTGCSDGGREALVEAQRYPNDFNGIVAGAAAMNFQVQNALFHAWQVRANTGPDGRAILLAGRLQLLHAAVLQACDGLDGIADGLVSDPLACRFDPARIQCASESQDPNTCLTASEVAAARKLYDDPRDPATGERLTVGGPLPGSELAWAGVYVPVGPDQPVFGRFIALEALRNMVFTPNPPAGFVLDDLVFDRALFERLRPLHPLYDATNPDLSPFAAAGGKLILWHGLADPHISPVNTIAYLTALQAQMGKEHAAAFSRLYLFPGMYHCSGGVGPSQVDLLTPMLAWVEAGTPPGAVIARQPERNVASDFGAPGLWGPGGRPAGPSGADRPEAVPRAGAPISSTAILRTRPTYPYPVIATYDGGGDPNRAESFGPGASAATFTMPAWTGADFYRPYAPRER